MPNLDGGVVVLTGIVGSVSYGTDTAASDHDLMSIVVPPLDFYFGSRTWGQSGTVDDAYESPEFGSVEHKYYEVRKALAMLSGFNPNIIPLLWMEPRYYDVLTPEGALLLENRHLFNSKKAYYTFSHYAHTQLQKMGGVFNSEEDSNMRLREGHVRFQEMAETEIDAQRSYRDSSKETYPKGSLRSRVLEAAYDPGYLAAMIALKTHSKEEIKRIKIGPITGRMGKKRKELREKFGYDTKFLSHTIRLMRMCVEFLNHPEEGLRVNRKNIDGEFLYSIREGKLTQEEGISMANELFAQATEAFEKTSLPDDVDQEAIHELTMKLIKQALL